MNAKNALHLLLLLSFTFVGAACTTTATTLPAQHANLDGDARAPLGFDRESSRGGALFDLHRSVACR